MAYVPVPKDLNAVKTKVLFNLTKRQLVCFGSGAAVGVPLFFLLRQSLSNSAAAICMIVVMLPFFLFALYEKNGLPLEKIIKNIVQVCFIRPKVRPYETDNFYAVLQRQDILDTALCRSLFPMSWKALISATSFMFRMKISHSMAGMSRKNQLLPLR